MQKLELCRKGGRDKKNNLQQLKEIAVRGHSKGTFVEGRRGEEGGRSIDYNSSMKY